MFRSVRKSASLIVSDSLIGLKQALFNDNEEINNNFRNAEDIPKTEKTDEAEPYSHLATSKSNFLHFLEKFYKS